VRAQRSAGLDNRARIINDRRMDPRVEEIITFWFGVEPVPSQVVTRRWFTRNADFDAEIRRRFGYLLGELDQLAHAWRGTPRSELALIVVADQFPRNLFRDDPRAYAHDPLALSVGRELLLSDGARTLGFHQRMIALMPFQHAEDLETQREGIAAFTALVEEARGKGTANLEMLESGLDFAKQHAAIIERFARFPHRNAILGRRTTPEELAFLAQPGSRF
jgi:uncharacterized protein (DUF924 family)